MFSQDNTSTTPHFLEENARKKVLEVGGHPALYCKTAVAENIRAQSPNTFEYLNFQTRVFSVFEILGDFLMVK